MAGSVGYLRVSSRAQDLASQRAAIEQAAAARGEQIESWYSEKASARTIARPELARLRADACRRTLRRVYVFRLDRLARSGIRDTFEVIEELKGSGVEIISVSDGFALDGPASEVVLAVLAWAAKMERLAINERISAARGRVEAEGRKWGRPERMDAATKRRVLALHAAGRSSRAIAVAVKV